MFFKLYHIVLVLYIYNIHSLHILNLCVKSCQPSQDRSWRTLSCQRGRRWRHLRGLSRLSSGNGDGRGTQGAKVGQSQGHMLCFSIIYIYIIRYTKLYNNIYIHIYILRKYTIYIWYIYIYVIYIYMWYIYMIYIYDIYIWYICIYIWYIYIHDIYIYILFTKQYVYIYV